MSISKRIIAILMTIVMTSAMIMPVIAYATETVTLSVYNNGTKLSSGSGYVNELSSKDITINISPVTNVSKISYYIGSEAKQTYTATASKTVTIPSTYAGKQFYITVEVTKKSGDTASISYLVAAPTASSTDTEIVTLSVYNDSKKLNSTTGHVNELTSNDIVINVSPVSSLSKISYYIGSEGKQTYTATANKNITIPSSYIGKQFYITVEVTKKSGDTASISYLAAIPNETDNETITLGVYNNGTKLNSKSGYVNELTSQNLTINVSPITNVSKIAYYIGAESKQSYTAATSKNITIPSSYIGKQFYITVEVTKKSGDTASISYLVAIPNETDNETITLGVYNNGTKLNSTSGYVNELTSQDLTINVSPITNVSKIAYYIGAESKQSYTAATSKNITIPSSYIGKQFYVTVEVTRTNGETASISYLVAIPKQENEIITLGVYNNGTKLNSTSGYINELSTRDISINVAPLTNVSRIYYYIGAEPKVAYIAENKIVTIPETYIGKQFYITVEVEKLNGETASISYLVAIPKTVTTDIDVSAYVDGNKLDEDEINYIEKNELITLLSDDRYNTKRLFYVLGNEDKVTIDGYTSSLAIPEEYIGVGAFTLQVWGETTDGNYAAVNTYRISIKTGESNIKYPFIILDDEKLNTNIDDLAISLRTVAKTEKTGNQNFFLLNEYVQYNIDFINGGDEINDDVTIEFNVPNGYEVVFVDAKGGTKVDDNTLRWTFDGLKSGEKGTIPVILYYTEISSGNMGYVQPIATIESSTDDDSSSVMNLIAKKESTVLELNHEPFMFGDAGTNTFRPNDGINRAEVAIILTRIFNLPLETNYTVTYKDKDVMKEPQFAWAESAIMTVTRHGLMQGYDDGTFRPGEKVTKAQLIAILSRYFATMNNNEETNPFAIKEDPIKLFNNLSLVYPLYGYNNHWASENVAQLLRLNMLPDFSNTIDGNLDLVISRADVAELISRVLMRGPANTASANMSLVNTFIDVSVYTENYEWILEATLDTHDAKITKAGVEKIQ